MELREWRYISPAGSTQQASSFSGYKKRFEKLIKYHIDHASSELESITRKDIKDESFVLSEHYNTGSEEFDRDIIVIWDKNTDTFYFSIYIDGRHQETNSKIGWGQFLKFLDGYMFLPSRGSSEWNDLLTESLNEWQFINPPQSTTSKNSYTTGQAYRYNKLLDQITSDGIAKYKLNEITNSTLDITVDTKKTKNLNIKITYDPADGNYTMMTNGWAALGGCDYEKDILPILQAGAVINNTDLCESTNSIADDFKLYENLWN